MPEYYRTPEDRRQYICPACDNSKTATTVTRETTADALNDENGIAWLGFSISSDIFEGKSAFKLMQAHGAVIFGEQPTPNCLPNLTLNGKKVHDPAQAVSQVERWVGRGEVELGSCTLCFEEMSRMKLVLACGRTGCGQKVDEQCLREWVSTISSLDQPILTRCSYISTERTNPGCYLISCNLHVHFAAANLLSRY